MHSFPLLLVTSILLSVVLVAGVQGRVLRTVEAERCEIICASADPRDAPSEFASGNGMTPTQWGKAKEDRIVWEENFRGPSEGLKLGIRYAFDRTNLEERKGPGLPEFLGVFVDGVRFDVALPTTGHWENFQTVLLPLPRMEAGKHVFRLEAMADHSDRNIDCFFFVRGELEDIPVGIRQTVIATHRDGFFELWTAPETVLPLEPDFILESCARIYDFLRDQTAFTPPDKKVGIHVRPDKYVGPHQFQNARGIWFSDSLESVGVGGFCHEMNHLFQPHVPGWMAHPLIRVNDAFVVPEALFPDHPTNRERRRRGVEFLRGIPRETDDPHTIAFALHVRYGAELQRKFFHILKAEREAGRLRAYERLRPEQFVEYMSQAAGNDLTPLFKRLRGYPDEVEALYE